MTKVNLDPTKMLGFRLLEAEETADGAAVMGDKSGKPPPTNSVIEAAATSAKIGKMVGKVENVADFDSALALSSKFGKVGKIRG